MYVNSYKTSKGGKKGRTAPLTSLPRLEILKASTASISCASRAKPNEPQGKFGFLFYIGITPEWLGEKSAGTLEQTL